MKVVQMKPMYFDAFYVSLLSEKYKSGHYNYLKAFWVGLTSNFKAMRSGEYSSLIYIVKIKIKPYKRLSSPKTSRWFEILF